MSQSAIALAGEAAGQPAAASAVDRMPESTIAIAWPSIGAFGLGRLVGRLSGIRFGLGGFFTLGKVFALATIPLTLVLYFWKLLPVVGRHYRLTNFRVVIERGLSRQEISAVRLDAFDDIVVDILPGQAFLNAGDLRFCRGQEEVFRLAGVSRPEPFRALCLKARVALLSVREVLLEQGRPPVGP